MDLKNESKKRKDFKDILIKLAGDEKLPANAIEKSKIYIELETLYYTPKGSEKFRHYYSDIFEVLSRITGDTSLGSIDILGQNLEAILNGYQVKNKDENGKDIDICLSIRKLYDHVNLDIARIRYSDAADRKSTEEENISKLKSKVEVLQKSIKSANSEIKAANQSMQNAQKDYITILGIFAAVVLTFTGGIAFSTSVLENLHQSSIYRIVVVSLIIGLVLINILYALFCYVDRLVMKKNEQKIKPLITVNVIIVTLIFATCIAWSNGWVERRNARMENNQFIFETVNTPDTLQPAPIESVQPVK